MKFENTGVFNIENAIRGMRNPLNSWDKSDSGYGCRRPSDYKEFVLCKNCEFNGTGRMPESYYEVGKKDLELANKLSKNSEERKFLRQIFVSVDVTGPLYW